ncbi:VapE domain-containing protein [Bacillus mobilis]|uniref:VapE domain-containing protein n=1 Tax=Bacillus mobilis TaxID=2026190 RepID=A0ABV4S678_9BACI
MALLAEQELKPIDFSVIPDELLERNQWVAWKRGEPKEDGTIPKIPCHISGKYQQSFKKCYDLNTVKDSYENKRVDGVGFSLVGVEDLVCIDLDADSIENIPQVLRDLIRHSYAEKSPSGNGLHVWIKGKWMGKTTQGKEIRYYEGFKIEFFYGTGYLTYTGHTVNGLPVEERQDLLQFIYDNTDSKQKKSPIVQTVDKTERTLDDSLVLQQVFKIDKVARILFTIGDISRFSDANGKPDHSKADYALLCAFAKVTRNIEQIDRFFRQSKIYRPEKWDKPSRGKYHGYWEIQRALSDTITDSASIPKPVETVNNENWQDALEYGERKNGDTYLLKNGRNAERILKGVFNDSIAFDAFKNAEAIKSDLPWRKRLLPHKPYESWIGSDDSRLLHWFETKWDISTKNIIQNAYIEVTRQNSFHPVKEYLESHTWDGSERVETFFIDYLGANDTPYIRAVTRKWIVAAVTRIYEPGCKFDYMPVLVGAQGAGKSSTIAKLAREWFSDSLKNFDNKEAGEHLQNSWIFEFGELAGMKKAEVEEIKAFITKTVDSYRVAYERVVSEFPRKCVFIGTTNTHDFLRDQTGNRRFWPITVDSKKQKYNPITELTDEIVGQIWAEAMELYRQGEKLYLDPELEAEARKVQEGHMEQDPRTGVIEEYLETMLPQNWDNMQVFERQNFLSDRDTRKTGTVKREKVCPAEIWTECLGNDYKNMKVHEARVIANILRSLDGWKERKPSRTIFKHYGKQTTFIRE